MELIASETVVSPAASGSSGLQVRQLVCSVLFRFEKSREERLKADTLLQGLLGSPEGQSISEQDRAFAHALTMGVLRDWFRLDAWIQELSGRKLKQLTPLVRVLLRMGLFQLDGLSQVPAHAAIHSTVELAKARKQSPKTIKFMNAVLREAQRRLAEGRLTGPTLESDWAGHLLWTYGWPSHWLQCLHSQYTQDEIVGMAQATRLRAGLSVRVNCLKIEPTAYAELLQQAGWQPCPVDGLPEVLWVPDFSGSPRKLPGYEEGYCYVQNASSVWVGHLLAPQPGERVLDLCAAPGSKTTHIAALMRNEGQITAVDPKSERLALLQENLQRLGVTNVHWVQGDGCQFLPKESGKEALYDKVLVDAPCSGVGTLGKHPEILLALKKTPVSALTALQLALLERGFDCLRPGGTLVYSTCSILKAENQDVVAAFVARHADARLILEEQRLITQNADGFYAARITKS